MKVHAEHNQKQETKHLHCIIKKYVITLMVITKSKGEIKQRGFNQISSLNKLTIFKTKSQNIHTIRDEQQNE